jgi:hypothetical protein
MTNVKKFRKYISAGENMTIPVSVRKTSMSPGRKVFRIPKET